MVTIEHGDLIEQRRGGVDVLRILVRNLAPVSYTHLTLPTSVTV